MMTSYVTVLPGQDFHRDFVCPPEAPSDAEVTTAVEWPDDLGGERWLLAELRRSARTFDNTTWSLDSSGDSRNNARFFVLISSTGETRQFHIDDRFGEPLTRQMPRDFFEPQQNSQPLLGMFYNPGFSRGRQETKSPRPNMNLQLGIPRKPPEKKLEWLVGHYYLMGLAITESPVYPERSELTTLPVLAAISFSGRSNQPELVEHPFERARSGAGSYPFSYDRGSGTRLPELEIPKFDAQTGEKNAWKITLPAPLVERVRSKLAEPPATDSTPKTES